MKTYCKKVDITDPDTIEPWVYLCISDPKKRNRPGFKRLSSRYGGAHGIAVEITERIKRRDLDLPPIQYRNRIRQRSQMPEKLRAWGCRTFR